MCKVKTGAEVQTNADLQNLVTSVILRQDKSFTKADIVDGVMKNLSGSPLIAQDHAGDKVKKTCDRTVMFMELSSGLRHEDEQYHLTIAFPSYNRFLARANPV